MKISHLQEGSEASMPTPGQPSAEFGRDKEVLESDAGTSTSGSITSSPKSVGTMQRRGKGSMLQGIKTSEKYANSQAVKEGAFDKRDAYQRDYDSSVTGFNKPVRQDDERNPEFDDKMRKLTGMIFYNVTDPEQAQQIGLKQTRTGKWFLRTGDRFAQKLADRAFGPGKVWYPKNESVEEGEELGSDSNLKSWQVVIFNNYYAGKYSDYRGRYYYVLASSPEEAKQVVIDNADGILQDLLSMKSHNGKKILPRGSAVRITPERIGKIEDGTVAGRMSTAGYKKMFGPQGLMMAKLSGGAVVDIQGQEQTVDEASFDYTMKDMGNDYSGFPSNHSMKHKMLQRIKPEKQQLYKDKMNNTHDFDDLLNLFNVAKQRGDIIEQGVAETRKANTKSARAEFGARKRKENPVQQDTKKKESDEAWERLMQYAASQKKEQGVAEEQELDEKSKSQAQFRTMAAVAHNPKFAKKVGISQKVGKEFHKADKSSSYKSLPKKVDEAEISEEQILAKELMKQLDLFKKGANKDISSKAKDKEISSKAKDKDIVAKEDCWDGYKQVGMKKKSGKTVPNCVPVKEMDGDGAGRDGSNRKSHSTYGSRDHEVSSGPDIHHGSESMMTSKQVQDRALDTLKKVLSKPENMNVLKRLKNK